MSSVFPPGVQLATRYRVLRLLESGHVGRLFEAEHLDTQRRVALKWLRFTGGGPAQLAQQRAAQVRAAILVRHPQLAVVHDVALEGSSLFVVSELLRGEPMRAFLAPHAMSLHERLRVLADAGRALAFAHKKGLVHGGLHPGNIFLHREHEMWVGLPPVVKVLDFGMATHAMPECLGTPAQRSAFGAHAFLDHAQLCGAEPDAQSDVYAFAVLLFQALTGCVPYAANSPIELAVTLATSPVPAVRDRHPGVPAPLEALIRESLRHDRRDRPERLEPLAAQVSAYAEALAARELFTAASPQHTLRMVKGHEPPGPQVTQLLALMGDHTTAASPVPPDAEEPGAAVLPPPAPAASVPASSWGTLRIIAPTARAHEGRELARTSTVPARPEDPDGSTATATGLRAEARPHQGVDAPAPPAPAADVAQPPPVAHASPRRTLELTQCERVVEISRQPTVVGQPATHTDGDGPRHPGYVEVLQRTRARPPLRLAVAPTENVLGTFARELLSPRARAWAAAAAAIFVLAGISASFALATDPDEPTLGAPPALPTVYRAPPAPQRRYRVEPPAQRQPAPADIEQKTNEPEDRAAAKPVDEAPSPARLLRRDHVHTSPLSRGTARVDASLTRARPEHVDTRPIKLESPSHEDGYLVGPLPTKDQF